MIDVTLKKKFTGPVPWRTTAKAQISSLAIYSRSLPGLTCQQSRSFSKNVEMGRQRHLAVLVPRGMGVVGRIGNFTFPISCALSLSPGTWRGHFCRSLANLSHLCNLNWGTIKSYLSSKAQANACAHFCKFQLSTSDVMLTVYSYALRLLFRPGHTYERIISNILSQLLKLISMDFPVHKVLSHLHVPFLKTPVKLHLSRE